MSTEKLSGSVQNVEFLFSYYLYTLTTWLNQLYIMLHEILYLLDYHTEKNNRLLLQCSWWNPVTPYFYIRCYNVASVVTLFLSQWQNRIVTTTERIVITESNIATETEKVARAWNQL